MKKPHQSVNQFILLLTIAVVLGLALGKHFSSAKYSHSKSLPNNPKRELTKLAIADQTIMVEVSDDHQKRELGLSGRLNLDQNEGMLFVFPEKEKPLFWMKDMVINLDMIWISDNQIMQINQDVLAPTIEKPKIVTISPSMPIDMVLEIEAGWVADNQVQIGDSVELVGYQPQLIAP